MGLRRILRKIIKPVERAVKSAVGRTGVKESNQAAAEANKYAAEAEVERANLERKTKKERARAQKLSIRGLRSKRSAGFYSSLGNPVNPAGSQTIG